MTADFKSRTHGWIAVAVALLVSLALAVAGSASARAAAAAEPTGDGSVTVTYTHDGAPVPGVPLELHRVASWGEDWAAEPTETFKGYQVDWPSLNGMDQNGLRDLANTLAGYVARDRPQALRTGETGVDGIHAFTDLPNGLYLVTYDAYRSDSLSCESGAALVSLPTRTDAAGAAAGVNVSMEPKADCEVPPTTPPDEKERLKVVKTWKDNGDAHGKRPAAVVVQLLKDRTVAEEVTLDASNAWTHEWTGLDKNHAWTAVEKTVPDGYATSTDREGATVTIVNTYAPPSNPPTNPPSNPPATPPSTISKTGAAVAGVTILAVVLLVAGLAVKRLQRRRQE